MSKYTHRLTRKRFERLIATKYGLQVREVHDIWTERMVNPLKRMQEKHQSEKQKGTKK